MQQMQRMQAMQMQGQQMQGQQMQGQQLQQLQQMQGLPGQGAPPAAAPGPYAETPQGFLREGVGARSSARSGRRVSYREGGDSDASSDSEAERRKVQQAKNMQVGLQSIRVARSLQPKLGMLKRSAARRSRPRLCRFQEADAFSFVTFSCCRSVHLGFVAEGSTFCPPMLTCFRDVFRSPPSRMWRTWTMRWSA